MHVLLCVQGLRDTPQAQGKGLLRILLLRGRPLPADFRKRGRTARRADAVNDFFGGLLIAWGVVYSQLVPFAAGAAVSAGVVISAAAMLMTGWRWLDSLAAILVSAVIAWTAFCLRRSSFSLALDAVPASIDRQAVAEWLEKRPGVTTLHDLQRSLWDLSRNPAG